MRPILAAAWLHRELSYPAASLLLATTGCHPAATRTRPAGAACSEIAQLVRYVEDTLDLTENLIAKLQWQQAG